MAKEDTTDRAFVRSEADALTSSLGFRLALCWLLACLAASLCIQAARAYARAGSAAGRAMTQSNPFLLAAEGTPSAQDFAAPRRGRRVSIPSCLSKSDFGPAEPDPPPSDLFPDEDEEEARPVEAPPRRQKPKPPPASVPFLRKCAPQPVPVLCFHDLSERTQTGTIITPVRRFVELLQYLSSNKYQTCFTSQIPALLSGDPSAGLKEGYKPIVLTFDDGYRNNYRLLFPLLTKFKIRATIFLIVAKLVETRENPDCNALTWAEVRQMVKSGFVEIGSHTFNSHVNMENWWKRSRRHYELRQRIWADLYTSRAILEAELSTPIRSFAWPLGRRNATLVRIADDAGFDMMFSTHFGINVPGVSELHDLNRINASSATMTIAQIAQRLRVARRRAYQQARAE